MRSICFAFANTKRSRVSMGKSTKTYMFQVGLAVLFMFPPHIQAKMNCSNNALCIEDVDRQGKADIYAINKRYHSISGTINVSYQHMQTSTKFPLEFHLKGQEKKLLFSLRKTTTAWGYHYKYTWVGCDTRARNNRQYTYRLPYQKNKKFRVSQSCNGRISHFGKFKYAIDFEMPIGTPIYAAREGIVIIVKEDSNTGGYSKNNINKANYITIEHADGTIGEYVHLKHNGSVVKVGDKVSKGDLIGYSGNTGYTQGPHLHFGVFLSNDGKNYHSVPVKFDTARGAIQCPGENDYLRVP